MIAQLRDQLVARMAQESPEYFKDVKVPVEMLDKFDAICFVEVENTHLQWMRGLIFRVIGYARPPHEETRYLLFCDDPRLRGEARPVVSPPNAAVRWIKV